MPERYRLQKRILVPQRNTESQRRVVRTFEAGTDFLYCFEINRSSSPFVLLCRDYQKISKTETHYSDLLKLPRADFNKIFVKLQDILNNEEAIPPCSEEGRL